MAFINDTCPNCGDVLDYDEVDVGAGTIRGNPGCPSCHWPDPRPVSHDPPAPDNADPPEPGPDDPPAPDDGRLFESLQDVGRRAFGIKYEGD